jgi:lipoyl(octanoyl) transferase
MDSVLTRPARSVAPGGSSASGPQAGAVDLEIRWLGRIPYRQAWAEQHALVAARAAGQVPDQLLLLEHPPVLTLGRQADPAFVRISPPDLARRGLELIRTERGGEVTYHGPGQLVAYPIVHLAERHLMVRPFVRLLEAAMRATCAALGVEAERRDGYPGCWVGADGVVPRKIGALGVRVEHGVTYHGIALNITVDLAAFDLIEACGLPGVTVTSIARELGHPDEAPSTASVRRAAHAFGEAFQRLLECSGSGTADVPDVGS